MLTQLACIAAASLVLIDEVIVVLDIAVVLRVLADHFGQVDDAGAAAVIRASFDGGFRLVLLLDYLAEGHVGSALNYGRWR